MIGLKPCPFCGRRIEIWDNLENGRMIYYVRCSCGAAFYNKFRSPEQAAEK